MERREFLKGSALAAVRAPGMQVADAGEANKFVVENRQLAWHLTRTNDGIRSTAFENRISGSAYTLDGSSEFTLLFSQGTRLEIPWWQFKLGDGGQVEPERERGLAEGFNKFQMDSSGWRPVFNLAGGQSGRVYDGYGWFRSNFTLPETAKGKQLVFVLGGYDQQDWNERWVYVNEREIGHSKGSGRWRTPGQYTLHPADDAYALLQFGPRSANLLAVRGRAYDFRFGNLDDRALERYVFRPFLFDQFISIEPPFQAISRLEIRDFRQDSPERIRFALYDPDNKLGVTAHYELNGFVRRKWLEIQNQSDHERLLLDIEVDRYQMRGRTTEGGQGDPVFLDDQVFFALDHPAGVNQGNGGGIRLWHAPGKKIKPKQIITSQASVVGVAQQGGGLDQFHRYIESRSPRTQKKHISIFTCYGINNQWGACPALTDPEVLDCQRIVGSWQERGVKFDYFTIDQGWPDNSGDLTEFASACYPDGPENMVKGLGKLGMRFGLWFSVSWGGWSDGSYAPIQSSAIPEAGSADVPPVTPPLTAYRNGYPVNGGIGRQLCLASPSYFDVFNSAIRHHVQHNNVRLIKLDSGNYYCNSSLHDHLAGKYSTEAMFDRLIDIVQGARSIAPDVFVLWYWGVGTSPFWALHGDGVFESGLFMEGSGTSSSPALYYRDSVTLSLDQNTRFATLIPPLLKDSLGVWLSQIRWANFMGKKRWREALMMDLGRGNLIFPQLWGDPNLLNSDDISFLADCMTFARKNEATLLKPRRNLGNAWKNEPYGYAFFDGPRGLVFCNNMHFSSRKLRFALGPEVGLSAPRDSELQLTTYFPERSDLRGEDGTPFRVGAEAEIWMRPFETLVVEVSPRANTALSRRQLTAATAGSYGQGLTLNKTERMPWMELTFADAARFEKAGLLRTTQCFSTKLPRWSEDHSVLAIHVKLSQSGKEYRYSPVVAEIVQMRVRLGGHDLQLIPIPDPRQYGNTQHAGCSWVVYKALLSPSHSEQALEFAVHSYLPGGVEAQTEAWLVKKWWSESPRPEADGYYGDAPS